MIEIELSAGERDLIRLWIEDMREAASHWGDGAAVFPDEAIVETKLERPGLVRLPRRHLEMIVEWAESSHLNTAFTAPELMLLARFRDLLSRPGP